MSVTTRDLPPATIVIFGVTGDLSTRKLLPALYELFKNNLLHEKTRIVGVSRHTVQVDDLLTKTRVSVTDKKEDVDEAALQKLGERIETYEMDSSKSDGYEAFKKHLEGIEESIGVCMQRVFYMSVPPTIAVPIITNLGENGLSEGCSIHKKPANLLMEKPFGFDTESAQKLIEVTTKYFNEEQIFRIDHYLAKETVQNIVTFRFRNPIFADIWNNEHVSRIEIIGNEKIDIEGRANFYEQTGALRDLIQSHLLHLLSVVMMDEPKELTSAHAMHESRQAILDSIEPVQTDSAHAIRAQYDGYKEEVDNDDSIVETFVALRLASSNEKWRDVPLIVQTGKALSEKETKVTVCFKGKDTKETHANKLIFNIQPNEGIDIELWVKKPGFEEVLQQAHMRFSYLQTFDEAGHPDAYERVLVDAVRGDNTLFATSGEVMSSWRIIEPVIQAWKKDGVGLVVYEKNSPGPDTASLYGSND